MCPSHNVAQQGLHTCCIKGQTQTHNLIQHNTQTPHIALAVVRLVLYTNTSQETIHVSKGQGSKETAQSKGRVDECVRGPSKFQARDNRACQCVFAPLPVCCPNSWRFQNPRSATKRNQIHETTPNIAHSTTSTPHLHEIL
jgi:hypothetical protein